MKNAIAEFLVGSIDDMGYIRRNIQDIVDDLAFTQGIYTDEPTVERILHLVQDLEPAGVGALFDLQEYLICCTIQHKGFLRIPHTFRINVIEQQLMHLPKNITINYYKNSMFPNSNYAKLLMKLKN